VNNTRTLDRVPMRNTDWFNYGGIYREVTLYDLPAAFISDLFIRLSADGTAIEVDLSVDGAKDGLAAISIPALSLQAEIMVQGGRGHIALPAQPQLWSPDSPTLYDVEVRFGDDHVTDRVGFRTLARRGTDILLNGQPIWLRGISVHEDDQDLGKVCTEADLRRRFEHARALGCNFLRLAHYPHHELAARLADEMGFLLWSEIPVYWAIAFDNPQTYADAENQLLELIRRDRNRASVAIWSVGNENPDTDARLTFMRNLAQAARAADPTRLIAAACLINHARNRIEDRLAEHLDIIGINEYYGWYDENIADLIEIGRNSQPDRPVVISETGADGAIGPNAPKAGLFSEAYMTQVYRQQIEILRELDYVKGMSPWILYDFRVERRQNIFQQGFNRKGLVAADKTTRKAAFDVLAAFYHARAEGRI
jgi:beta-glucuronidase